MINTSITLGYTSTLDPKTHNPIQKTLEPCEDCVSREAVLKSLCELRYGDEENGAEAEYMYALRCVADKVKALPSVTPERPKGEWITWREAGNEIASDERHECSCCHDSAQWLNGGLELLSDYCPNCGADMRGGKE